MLSFMLAGYNNDIGAALNEAGIAVPTGHHYLQSISRRLSTVRTSLAFYNVLN